MRVFIRLLYGEHLLATEIVEFKVQPRYRNVVNLDIKPAILHGKPPLPPPPNPAYNSEYYAATRPTTPQKGPPTMDRRAARRKRRMDAGSGLIQRFLDPDNDHPILRQLWQQFQPMIQQLLTQLMGSLIVSLDQFDEADEEDPPTAVA